MARVKIERIIEQFPRQFKKALEDAVSAAHPHVKADGPALYRAFQRAVRHQFQPWETVPDTAIEPVEQQ
jgi:hypothetical protein